jgi:hypothetical protein
MVNAVLQCSLEVVIIETGDPPPGQDPLISPESLNEHIQPFVVNLWKKIFGKSKAKAST